MRTKHSILFGSALLAAAWLAACDVAHPCDPGQRHVQGACITPMPKALDAGSTDADASAMADDDAGAACSEAENASLGKTCMSNADCGCSDPYCALMPGATKGICTVTGCTPMGSDCPTGYECFDVSMFGISGYPTFCIAK
ncbi:MAG TPA: hypothetical protein VHM19_15135 [Polyangiales bacterium]|jgi:hypothetical protein|nr:hypothetical protein [Polyangiales bacterium]